MSPQTQLLGYHLFNMCACSGCFSRRSSIFQSHVGASWLPSCTKTHNNNNIIWKIFIELTSVGLTHACPIIYITSWASSFMFSPSNTCANKAVQILCSLVPRLLPLGGGEKPGNEAKCLQTFLNVPWVMSIGHLHWTSECTDTTVMKIPSVKVSGVRFVKCQPRMKFVKVFSATTTTTTTTTAFTPSLKVCWILFPFLRNFIGRLGYLPWRYLHMFADDF